MVQLEGTENRVSYAREEYNRAAAALNAAGRRFPGMLIVGFTELVLPVPLYAAKPGAQDAPAVRF